LERVISQTALHTLNALDLGWGPAHLEMRLADEKPKIIEVNPRLAGGFIPELVRFAYGLDLISETLKRVTGQEPHLEKRSNGYASLRFILPANNGFITGVENLAVATQVPGVVEMRLYSEVGSFVQRQGDFRDRIGHVIATGDTPEAACAAAESALSRIRVILEERSTAPTEER
jgi:biotin carboxylase